MSRYIDADILIKELDITEDLSAYDAIVFEKMVNEQPTADVRENVHGEWILDDSSINCSVCGRSRWSVPPFENLVKSFNYCPHCGADIREEVEE